MLDVLKNWILTVTGTALISSAALALTPEGGVKRVVKLICGLAMMAALMSILGQLDASTLGRYVWSYRERAENVTQSAIEGSASETRFIIEAECEAYILDKAAQLGIAITDVQVTARWSDDGYWYPAEAHVRGEESGALSAALETELGIPKNKQIWSTDDGD